MATVESLGDDAEPDDVEEKENGYRQRIEFYVEKKPIFAPWMQSRAENLPRTMLTMDYTPGEKLQ